MADNKKIAEAVLAAVGGKDNVTSVTHCMTRLRFNLKDESIPKDEEVKALTGVLGVARAGGQYQVIIGQNVPKVYAEICSMGGFAAQGAIEENLDAPKEKLTPKKVGSNILNYMAGSLTPLIPVMMAAAMFRTIIAVFGPDLLNLFNAESDIYILFDFMYNAGYYFMPILIGFTAAKKLGASQMLGAYMGAILIAPGLIALVDSGAAFTVFGIPCQINNYSQSILPILLSVWVLSYIEKFFKKFIPDALSTIFVPFLTMLVITPISLIVLAPLGSILGSYVGKGLIAFGNVGGFVAVALVAALWELLVMSGMHVVLFSMMIMTWMETGVLEGVYTSVIYATFAAFGVALGAALRMKNKQEKSTAFGFFVSGLIGGVTEPTLYGLCIKYKRPFIGLIAGGAIGGLYAGLTHVTMYMLASSNFLVLIGLVGGGTANIVNGIIASVLSMLSAAIVTYLFGFDKNDPVLQKG